MVDEQLDIICRFTPEGLLTFVNNAYCELFNKKPEELLGFPFINHIYRDDLDTVSVHLSKISEEHPVRYSQNRMVDGSGKVRWINWVDRGIYKNGSLIETQGVGRDITEDMNTKIISDSLEKRYQNMIEEMPVVVYMLHASTLHPLYISPHIYNLAGYTMDDIYLTRDFLFEIIHPEDKALVEEGFKQRIKGHKESGSPLPHLPQKRPDHMATGYRLFDFRRRRNRFMAGDVNGNRNLAFDRRKNGYPA